MKSNRKYRRGSIASILLLVLVALPLLVLGLLWLWAAVGSKWGDIGHQILFGSTTLFIIWVIYLIWGYRHNRLLFSLGSGQVVAPCYGSPETGEIVHYVITKGDHIKAIEKRDEIAQRIDDMDDTAARDRAKKDAAKRDLAGFDKFMEERVKIAGGGLLGWILRPFNLFFMSPINPMMTLHGIDQGNTRKNGKLVTHFQWVDSPNVAVSGVDVSGNHGQGTFPISVRIQIGDLFFWNFDKVFAQEESTAGQKEDQMRAAANLLCRGHSSDEIEKRQFPESAYTAVYLDLLAFGMLGGAIRLTDFSLEGVTEARDAAMQLGIAGTKAQAVKVTAQGAADARVIAAQAQAKEIQLITTAEAGGLHKKLKRLTGQPPSVVRLALAPDNKWAAIPDGVQYLALGEGAKAPEPYVDVTQSEPTATP